VRLYVNGVEESSLSYAGKTVVPLQGSKILGGSLPNFPADFIDGQLDEVGIYNRALSLAEIQTLASAGNAGNSSGVVVNLPLNAASGLTGGIARIQNVIGSAGNDILVGSRDDGDNVLSGGAGHDLLIAGAFASTLNGGDGDDILIGGTTDYDTDINQTALRAILGEWVSARTTSLLNADTVHSNGKANKLTGGADADLFFARLGSELLDFSALDARMPLP
jgi:Ca2+-binding RTX toxin-like protein